MNKIKKIIIYMAVLSMLASGCANSLALPVNSPEGTGAEGQKDTEISAAAPGTSAEGEEDVQENVAEVNLKNYGYISVVKANIQEDHTKEAKILGSLQKGSRVEILEEKVDESEKPWVKIFCNIESKDITGWLAMDKVAKDRSEVLADNIKNLDFSPQNKIYEYPGNPRVEVRGIYLTKYSASNSRLDKLIEMTKTTKINTFVIDVKDDKGHMLFKTKAAEKYSPDANKHATVKDIAALMQKLKENNIYTIARIVSFKDPTYANHHPDMAIINTATGKPFTNSDGLVWVSAHDRNLWEYNLEVCKEAAAAGFKEIQFDYVRFPASNGGKLDKVLNYRNVKGETKPETIQGYLKYAREQLSPLNVYISADIYGLVGSVSDDMALGQHWEAVSNIVDYVSPMMYPSHYANGTYKLSVPDAYPYETLYYGTKDAVQRNKNIDTPATIRPWIQDFTATWVKGYIKYSDKQVLDQIRGMEENGVTEYLLWNASNRYSEGAVK